MINENTQNTQNVTEKETRKNELLKKIKANTINIISISLSIIAIIISLVAITNNSRYKREPIRHEKFAYEERIIGPGEKGGVKGNYKWPEGNGKRNGILRRDNNTKQRDNINWTPDQGPRFEAGPKEPEAPKK